MEEVKASLQSNETQKLEFERIAQDSFNKILAAYRVLIDGLSNDHFKLLDDVINKETNKKFDVEKAGNVFKEELYESIKKKFTKLWKEMNMESSIVMLEYSKKHHHTSIAWRPTDKCANEQAHLHLIKMFKDKREYIKKHIAFQQSQIANIIPQLEEVRMLLKKRIEKHDQIMSQIAKDKVIMKKTDNQIDDIIDIAKRH